MTKLNVLIVPDSLTWILGVWANQIVRVGTKHDYFFFTQQMLPYYAEEWKKLLSLADVVHFLSPYDLEKLAVPANTPKINAINHVVFWDSLAPYIRADAIMVVAEEWQNYLLEKGIPPERIFLLRNGVDTSRFYPLGDKLAARQQLGIDSTIDLIGFSAKYTSNEGGRKGVDIFLAAVQQVAATGQKFGVLITGPGWDDAVKTLEGYGVEVYYRPFLPDRLMPVLYNALDVYVVTSRVEGGPAPLLENMACGTPVVTTPVGLAIEYIETGVNGLMVPKENASETAAAIGQLLASPELRDRLAEAALKTVTENLTWDKTLAKVEQMYELVWQQSGNAQPKSSTETIDPITHRQWVARIDPFLWFLQLVLSGHFEQGWQGLQESSSKVSSREKLWILGKTPFVIASNQVRRLKSLVKTMLSSITAPSKA